MIRIAVDARYLCDAYPGIGRYLFNLLEALPGAMPGDDICVLTDPSATNTRHDLTALERAGCRLVAAPLPTRSLRERTLLARTLRRLAPDLVHRPYHFGPAIGCPEVLSLHDTIPLRRAVPRGFVRRSLVRLSLRAAARRAARLLVPTATVASDVERLIGIPPERIALTPYGVAPNFAPASAEAVADLRQRLGLPPRYVLHLGSAQPHKGTPTLVAAWRALGDRRGHALVLAGGAAGGEGARVLGPLDDADLAALYTGATLFVLPSLDEGFGLPLLEAQACGVACLVSAIPALIEVGGSAVATFEPGNAAALAERLAALLDDPEERTRLAGASRAQARAFSWRETARRTAAAYRSTLAAGSGPA